MYAILGTTTKEGNKMTNYEIAKVAAWEIYSVEAGLAGNNYSLRAIAFAKYNLALQNALEVN